MGEFGEAHDASQRHIFAERNQMLLVVSGAQTAAGINRMQAIPQYGRLAGCAAAA